MIPLDQWTRRSASFLTVLLLLAVQRAVSANDVLSPAAAAKFEGTNTSVVVEFTVKSCHPVLPDGKHFRLVSEPSFKEKQAFIVHLTELAVAKLKIDDLERAFLGKKIRVQGKVQKTILSSIPDTRPGISIDDPERIRVLSD